MYFVATTNYCCKNVRYSSRQKHFYTKCCTICVLFRNLKMTPSLQKPAPRAIIALIGIAAILGNALVLLVFYRRRKKFVRTTFDMFIINLAVSDLIAGVFILFSRFVFQPHIPENYASAMTYCYLLWGGYVLFGCGMVSICTCLVLAIERWLAIVKPHFYRRLKPRHTIFTIVVVWIWSFLTDSTMFFTIKANFDTRSCYWVSPKTGKAFFAFVEICMSSILPFSLIIILYSHIYYKVRKMKNVQKNNFKKRLTIIALAASLALIIGWLPSKISFMLRHTSVGGKHLGDAAYLVLVSLSLSNSFINPFLYGIYSSKFRNEYKEVLSNTMRKLTKCGQDKRENETETEHDIEENNTA